MYIKNKVFLIKRFTLFFCLTRQIFKNAYLTKENKFNIVIMEVLYIGACQIFILGGFGLSKVERRLDTYE